jgi:hypothetical protein
VKRRIPMIMPDQILTKICHHFGQHINAVHEAAQTEDPWQLKWLEDRHHHFKSNVRSLLDMHIEYLQDLKSMQAPTKKSITLWSVSVMSVEEPAFPDYIGAAPRWVKLTVVGFDGVYTALYSLEGWEEEYEYVP